MSLSRRLAVNGRHKVVAEGNWKFGGMNIFMRQRERLSDREIYMTEGRRGCLMKLNYIND